MLNFNKHIHWIFVLLIPAGAIKYAFLLNGVQGFSWDLCVVDTLANLALAALSIWVIIILIKAYPTKVTAYTYSVMLSIGMAAVTVILLKLGLKLYYNQPFYEEYHRWFTGSLFVRVIFYCLLYSWIATNTALRKTIAALDSRFQQQTDTQNLLREAELFKLRQQLQPHFLYNSLNSISALILTEPDKAQEMIGKLSDFLRGSVKRDAEDHISLKEEMNYLESYLAIESVRFGDRLKVEYELHVGKEKTVPPFLLQPLLENAIKFGLYGQTGQVLITFNIHEQDGMVFITITNPFDATSTPPKGTGFGLEGVARRLFLMYARTDLLETHKQDNIFTTILKIPQHV